MRSAQLVAWNLRRLRVRRGLSQQRLALQAGVDRSYLSRLERAIENPTVGLLDQLAAVLEAPVSEFLREPEPGEAAPRPLPAGRRGGDGNSCD